MLLTITAFAGPDLVSATDLGYLLHKHPDRVQHTDLPVGRAHVFYPEATESRCTAALLLEVDPVGLLRNRRLGGDGFTLGQYVNDRPYAASSLLAVAIGRVFGSALHGRCDAHPELASRPLSLQIAVPAVPTGGEPGLVARLFAPLRWEVEAASAPLDPEIPRWGEAPYVSLVLRGTHPLADALRHLYVLLPVLDGAKHYWVGGDEVDKLLRAGGPWLAGHPERELIMRRYLARQRSLVADATQRLEALEDAPDGEMAADNAGDAADRDAGHHAPSDTGPLRPGTPPGGESGAPPGGEPRAVPALSALRRAAILDRLRLAGARRVIDVGCGEGSLLRDLLADSAFEQILGVDVSARELSRAATRLAPDRLPDRQRQRISLLQSSATYLDDRLAGWDAAVLSEVIEHLDPERLPALERAVFGHARPGVVVVTTPNADYNPLFPGLPRGALRHPDHRFEFTREQFAGWCERVEHEFGYRATISGVGDEDPERGAPTQLAVLTRAEVTS